MKISARDVQVSGGGGCSQLQSGGWLPVDLRPKTCHSGSRATKLSPACDQTVRCVTISSEFDVVVKLLFFQEVPDP